MTNGREQNLYCTAVVVYSWGTEATPSRMKPPGGNSARRMTPMQKTTSVTWAGSSPPMPYGNCRCNGRGTARCSDVDCPAARMTPEMYGSRYASPNSGRANARLANSTRPGGSTPATKTASGLGLSGQAGSRLSTIRSPPDRFTNR